MKKIILVTIVLFILLWAGNTSLFYSHGNESYKFVAHRGVHQTFDHQGLESDSCTADLIRKSDHAFLENTIPSMRQAFAKGAQVIEFDVHLTKDNKLAVFHDWTLDCRTDGSGKVRDHDMPYLGPWMSVIAIPMMKAKAFLLGGQT